MNDSFKPTPGHWPQPETLKALYLIFLFYKNWSHFIYLFFILFWYRKNAACYCKWKVWFNFCFCFVNKCFSRYGSRSVQKPTYFRFRLFWIVARRIEPTTSVILFIYNNSKTGFDMFEPNPTLTRMLTCVGVITFLVLALAQGTGKFERRLWVWKCDWNVLEMTKWTSLNTRHG